MKLIEIIKRNRDLGSKLTGDKYKIIVLSNITVNQIKEVLELALRESGVNAEVEIGNYDAILHDSRDLSKYNAVLVFWELSNLIENLHVKCNLMKKDLFIELQNGVEGEVNLLLSNLEEISLVLINRFSTLAFDTNPFGSSKYKMLCKYLNTVLESNKQQNKKLIDIDMIISNIGLGDSIDYRQYQATKALYAIKFYDNYVNAIKSAFLSATGQVKKLLILDCDNTLWKGVLGEDGESGIQMNRTSITGKPFYEIQNIIKSYKESGVLLALCSKNNMLDIERVLKEHPDMILKEDDFIVKKINWENKAINIREISLELNLGLDSFIFIDDSDFEIGLIQKELPQVKCVRVPENISEYPLVVRKLIKEFNQSTITIEDTQKTIMYQQEQQRKLRSKHFDSIEEYLVSLNLKVNIMWDNQISVARASQMTQKTNQFNLTTRRYTESDIQRMLNNDLYSLSVFEVTDRYGNYGVTGLVIIKRGIDTANCAIIDSFLMSCRIIGRNIEYAVFAQIVDKLQEVGINTLQAEYIVTAKNKLVERFYDSLGFKAISFDKKYRKYQLLLENYSSSDFQYIEITNKGW